MATLNNIFSHPITYGEACYHWVSVKYVNILSQSILNLIFRFWSLFSLYWPLECTLSYPRALCTNWISFDQLYNDSQMSSTRLLWLSFFCGRNEGSSDLRPSENGYLIISYIVFKFIWMVFYSFVLFWQYMSLDYIYPCHHVYTVSLFFCGIPLFKTTNKRLRSNAPIHCSH